MFQGFDDATVDFMWGIRFNNEKGWFEEHKEAYVEHFYRPMKELGAELFEHIAPQLSGYGLTCKVSRIYRDARRLRGRGPYKDHLWISIQQPAGAWDSVPCFWFELGPEGWSYGLGYYMAEPATMAKLRRRLAREPKEPERLMRKLAAQREFTLQGQEYKRPKGEAPSELLAPWFRLRNFTFIHEEALTEELFSRALLERLKEGYDFLLPWYRYLATLSGEEA